MNAIVSRILWLVFVTALGSPSVAQAAVRQGCQPVAGLIFELEVPANEANNPINHGRLVGVVTGSLKGAETSILTGGAPPPPGAFAAVSTQNVFVNRFGDMLVANGLSVVTFNPDGTVAVDLTLTIDGGASTGQFAGTTGTIHATGVGFNFGGGPGVGRFELSYQGEICGDTEIIFDDELEKTIAALQAELTAATQTIADRDTQIATLEADLQAANQTTATLRAQIASLEGMLQIAVGDPAFTIAGTTPLEQIQNLIAALNGLNPGQKLALYRNLGGNKNK